MKTSAISILAILILFVFQLLNSSLYGQEYSFTYTNAVYQELDNPEMLTTDFELLELRLAFNGDIGSDFDIQVFNKNIDQDSLIIGVDGFLVVGTTNSKHLVAIDPFFVRDLSSIDNTSSISHKIEKVNGLNVYKVQWKNVQSSEFPGKFLNFQIWVEERSQNVTFSYGPTNISSTSTSVDGIQIGVFLIETASNTLEELLVVQGNPAAPTGSSQYSKIYEVPQEGMHYHFTNKTYTAINRNFDQEELLQVYPNPTQGEFTIEGLNDGDVVSIFDNLGSLILKKEVDSTFQIAFSLDNGISKGVYFIHVNGNNGRHVRKLIVQ